MIIRLSKVDRDSYFLLFEAFPIEGPVAGSGFVAERVNPYAWFVVELIRPVSDSDRHELLHIQRRGLGNVITLDAHAVDNYTALARSYPL